MSPVRTTAALALLLAATAGPAQPATPPSPAALRPAAEAGDEEAQFALGEAYRLGRGVPADPDTATMWYKRAAAQGHVGASDELGFFLFARGSRREAMPYVEKAAARGEPRAMYLLGTAHFNGDYASRDWPLAYALMTRASSAGLAAATKSLAQMDKYLLPADHAKADAILPTLAPVQSLRKARAAAVSSGSMIPLPAAPPSATPIPTVSVSSTVPPIHVAPVSRAPQPPAVERAGKWRVQLGAFGSADRAQATWGRLTGKVPALGRLDQRIVAAGSVQRLQAVGLAGKAQADALCREVRGAGGDCFPVAP